MARLQCDRTSTLRIKRVERGKLEKKAKLNGIQRLDSRRRDEARAVLSSNWWPGRKNNLTRERGV
jgi:hypothetical protein